MNKSPLSSLSGHPNLEVLKITGIYLILGSAWILFTGRLATIGPYKDWGYLLVSAILLYWLVNRLSSRLQTNVRQLHLVINALPALISYVDSNRRYQFTNEAYQEWFGEKAQGKYLVETLGQAAYQKISKYVDKALSGETVFYETEIPYQDGGARFVNATYIPDIAGNRQVKGFFALVQDISEQKEAREKLRQWADAFEGCAHGIAIDDVDTNRIAVCNPAFANMHKSKVEDIVGSSILSLYAPSEHEHVRAHIERADQIGHARYESQMIRKDGSIFPVQMDIVSVLGGDGELLYRVVTGQDISERKRAEEILQESEERYRMVSELTSDYAYKDRVEADGSIVAEWFTESFTKITGYTLEETHAPGFWEHILYQEDLSVLLRHVQKILSGQSDTDEMRVITKTGETRWIRDFANPIWDAAQQRVGGLYGAVQDVTEHKLAQEKLKKSEERYRYLFENHPYPMWIYDRKTLAFLDVNEAAILKYGYTRQEFLNMTIVDIRPSEDVDHLMNNLAQPRQPLEHSDSWKHRLKDGTIIHVEITSHTLDIDGHESALVIAQDVSERVQAEEHIAYQAKLLDNINDAIIASDEQFRLTAWNAAAESMYGWKAEEVLGRSGVDIMRTEFPGTDPEVMRRIIAETGRWRGEAVQLRKDGTRIPVEVASIALRELDGKIKGYVSVNRDISERKQAEAALQKTHDELEIKVQERTAALSQANALLQALMDYVPDHIYFKDLHSRFIRNSRSQASSLGLSDPAQAVGKTDFDFFPHAAKAYAEEQEVMRSGNSLVDFEEWVVWPDGRETWVSTTKVPLRNSEGETIGIFGISRNITERKRAEQSIRELNSDLESQAVKLQAANKELEAFSYSVSHDLRAPLRAIDGYTRILVEDYEGILDAEGKRICGIISAEARRMGQLIDDLLAFSRLGRKEMYSTNVDMKTMVVSVLNELIKEEERERTDFKIARLPSISADSSLMRQVWVNLLSNAIKFTSKKERAIIEVGSKSNKDEIIYYVHDTGAGFDMEYANKLFGVFQRLHSESEFDGTGVGLAIVQRIIRRHGGRVWAEGEVDKGATFYFALPRKENQHE